MKLFISVSGEPSTCIGQAIFRAVGVGFQGMKPWLAKEKIDKGRMWREELGQELAGHAAGIFVLTRANQNKPWICFEAGAVAALSRSQNVFTVCVDFPSADVEAGPLSAFQHTESNFEDLRRLAESINKLMPTPLESGLLETCAEAFAKSVMQEIESCRMRHGETSGSGVASTREDADMLRELIDLARENSRQLSDLAARGSFLNPGFGVTGMAGAPSGTSSTHQGSYYGPSENGPQRYSVTGGTTKVITTVSGGPTGPAGGIGTSK
jgi:hypothetical protein